MENNYKNVRAYKAALREQMKQQEAAMRREINEIKDDLNPVRGLGKAVKSGLNFFKPPKVSRANTFGNTGVKSPPSDALKIVLDTALNFAIGRIIPDKTWPVVRSIAPMVLRKAYASSEPVLQNSLTGALQWVADATADPKASVTGTVDKMEHEKTVPPFVSCPCGAYKCDTKLSAKRMCTCGAVTFGAYGTYEVNDEELVVSMGNHS